MAFEYWRIMNEYGNGIELLHQTEQLHIQTDTMKYSPPWAKCLNYAANSLSSVQIKDFNNIHNSPPPDPVLSHMCPNHMTCSQFLTIHFNFTLLSTASIL